MENKLIYIFNLAYWAISCVLFMTLWCDCGLLDVTADYSTSASKLMRTVKINFHTEICDAQILQNHRLILLEEKNLYLVKAKLQLLVNAQLEHWESSSGSAPEFVIPVVIKLLNLLLNFQNTTRYKCFFSELLFTWCSAPTLKYGIFDKRVVQSHPDFINTNITFLPWSTAQGIFNITSCVLVNVSNSRTHRFQSLDTSLTMRSFWKRPYWSYLQHPWGLFFWRKGSSNPLQSNSCPVLRLHCTPLQLSRVDSSHLHSWPVATPLHKFPVDAAKHSCPLDSPHNPVLLSRLHCSPLLFCRPVFFNQSAVVTGVLWEIIPFHPTGLKNIFWKQINYFPQIICLCRVSVLIARLFFFVFDSYSRHPDKNDCILLI